MRRSLRALFVFVLATSPLALHAACGASADEAGAQDSGSTFGGSGGGSGGSSPEDGGNIDVGTDDDGGGGSPPNPLAQLCGIGPDDCTPGGVVDNCLNPSGSGGGTEEQSVTCKLVPGVRAAEPVCVVQGPGEEGSPCQSAEDCGLALGCVLGENQTAGGTCRRYCCEDSNACAYATYCTPRPMAEAQTIEIPVCAAASMCTLLNDATCPNGLTCAIVKDDGTTSCIEPGKGKTGESCPCAAGYTCIQALGECKKVCKLENQDADCPTGMCIGGSGEFPEGYGICTP